MANVPDIIKQAEHLRETDCGAALALLHAHRPAGRPIAQPFESIIAQTLMLDGQVSAAVAYLQEREVLAPQGLPPPLTRILSDALILNGAVSEAGVRLAKLVAAGTAPELLSFKQKHAVLDTWMAQGHAEGDIAALKSLLLAESCVYDTNQNVALIFCPKVACSMLKATMIMNSPARQHYIDLGFHIHAFTQHMLDAATARRMCADPDVFRYTVLRDPARRVLSAYLDKFLNVLARPIMNQDRAHAVRRAQALAGIAYDPERSISFAEFCNYLAQANDLEMNTHWMPQSRIVGRDTAPYAFVGCFENLDQTLALLREKFGYDAQTDPSKHLAGGSKIIRNMSPVSIAPGAASMLPRALRSFGDSLPAVEDFLPPSLRDVLERRYADDVALHRSTQA